MAFLLETGRRAAPECCPGALPRASADGRHRKGQLSRLFRVRAERRSNEIWSEGLHRSEAVSYTHLDVYKRQVQADLKIVDELDDTQRGAGGFGSTGK